MIASLPLNSGATLGTLSLEAIHALDNSASSLDRLPRASRQGSIVDMGEHISRQLRVAPAALTVDYPASPSTSVAFPSSSDLHQGPPVPPSPHRRRPLISFRRISLPPPPALLNRQSSASLTSFDSFPDGNTNELVPDHTSAVKGGGRNLLHKQSHAEAGRRHRKRRESVKPQPEVDENKAVKRRKIIAEFYDTERAYIRGLDLIYSVRGTRVKGD